MLGRAVCVAVAPVLPDAARFLDGARFIGEYGPFKAFQCAGIFGSQERVCIIADEKQMFVLTHDRRTKGSLHFAVISDIASGQPLLDCGTLEDGVLPGFWGMYPQKGPDAGRLWYGDYDLDGKFEVKVKLSNGLLTPEEITKHRPVREEAGKGGDQ